MLKLLTFYTLLALVSIQATFAQGNDVCKDIILAQTEKMQEYSKNQGNRIFYMHTQTSLIPNQTGAYANLALSPKDVELKIYAGAGKMYYESKYVAIYQDQEEAFMVIHPQKLIVWSKESPQEADQNYKQALTENLGTAQKQLIEMSSVLTCREINWENKQVKKIEMIPNQKAREEFQIKKMIFYYDPQTSQILKQIINYTSNHKLKQQIITYHEMIFDYKEKIPKQARSYIFSKNEQLVSQYQNYQIERR